MSANKLTKVDKIICSICIAVIGVMTYAITAIKDDMKLQNKNADTVEVPSDGRLN